MVTTGSILVQFQPNDQVAERYSQAPAIWLVDGCPSNEKLDAIAVRTTVYTPVPKPKDPASVPHASQSKNCAAMPAMRQGKAADDAKAIYHDHAATAKSANAQICNRGLHHSRVRATAKVCRQCA